jgi:hypothetical protein
MKKLSIVFTSLMFISSLAFAEVLPPLFQAKRNNAQRQGITYTVVLPSEYKDEDPVEYIVTEQGKDKLIESAQYGTNKYLLKDSKVYQIPDLSKVPEGALVSIAVLSGDARTAFDEKTDKFKVPNYAGFVMEKKETVNGFQCQVATKIITEERKLDEYERKFTVQRILRVYITEKYGYPTRMERIIRSKYPRETNWTEAIQEQDTVDIINFNTETSWKNLTLPKNAFIENIFKPVSIDKRQELKKTRNLPEKYDKYKE